MIFIKDFGQLGFPSLDHSQRLHFTPPCFPHEKNVLLKGYDFATGKVLMETNPSSPSKKAQSKLIHGEDQGRLTGRSALDPLHIDMDLLHKGQEDERGAT